MMDFWRANCDLTIIYDPHDCIQYVTKYVTKSEDKSDIAKRIPAIVDDIIPPQDAGGTTTGVKFARKVMLAQIKERDYGMQEVGHFMTGGTIVKSDFRQIILPLNSSRAVDLDVAADSAAPANTSVLRPSIVDLYANRADNLRDMCLLDFTLRHAVRKVGNSYQLVERDLSGADGLYFVRVLPFSANRSRRELPASRHPDWWKWQLQLMRPWHGSISSACADCDASDPKGYEAAFRQFVPVRLRNSSPRL